MVNKQLLISKHRSLTSLKNFNPQGQFTFMHSLGCVGYNQRPTLFQSVKSPRHPYLYT